MSQVSSLSNVHLFYSSEAVNSIFKKSLDFIQNISIHRGYVSLKELSPEILIIDMALLEKLSLDFFNELLRFNCIKVFLEHQNTQQELKLYIENNFNYVLPFPVNKSVLNNYLRDIVIKTSKKEENFENKIIELTKKPDVCGLFDGNSKKIKIVRTEIEQASKDNVSVLLLGETGTGKTSGARTIHKLSARRNYEIVETSAATISDELAGSSLFGTVAGAYTDARHKKGLFYLADKSTLFIDEIGLASPIVQGMLLHVLSESKIQKIGSDTFEKVNVRLITATNEPLDMLVKEGKFRADLFYRINGHIINLPPLRERKEDIPAIVNRYLINKEKIISDDGMSKIQDYNWPGNIRELLNVLENLTTLSTKEVITADEISFVLSGR